MFIPLSVEVIVEEFWLCAYPSCVEMIVVEFGFVPIPLSIEVIVVVWLSALSL